MKPYPSVAHAYASEMGPVISSFEPTTKTRRGLQPCSASLGRGSREHPRSHRTSAAPASSTARRPAPGRSPAPRRPRSDPSKVGASRARIGGRGIPRDAHERPRPGASCRGEVPFQTRPLDPAACASTGQETRDSAKLTSARFTPLFGCPVFLTYLPQRWAYFIYSPARISSRARCTGTLLMRQNGRLVS